MVVLDIAFSVYVKHVLNRMAKRMVERIHPFVSFRLADHTKYAKIAQIIVNTNHVRNICFGMVCVRIIENRQ